jgi:A/G-specific adenine glycosylase
LPELNDFEELKHLAMQHSLEMGKPYELPGLVHTFSHFQLSIEPWLVPVQESAGHVAEADWLWYNLATPPRLGLAAPVKKLLKHAADVLNAGEPS